MAWGEGPFKVLDRVGNNARKLELVNTMNVTDKMGDPTPYSKDDSKDLRENPSQERNIDTNQQLLIPSLTSSKCNPSL